MLHTGMSTNMNRIKTINDMMIITSTIATAPIMIPKGDDAFSSSLVRTIQWKLSNCN